MTILARRILGRSRLVGELVDDLSMAGQRNISKRDIVELVLECLELCKLLKGTWQSVLGELFNEQVDDVEASGEMIRRATSRALTAFARVQENIVLASKRGESIENAEAFGDAMRELQKLKAEVEKRWPTFDRQQIEESLAAFRRGEYQTTEELLCESQNRGAQAS